MCMSHAEESEKKCVITNAPIQPCNKYSALWYDQRHFAENLVNSEKARIMIAKVNKNIFVFDKMVNQKCKAGSC